MDLEAELSSATKSIQAAPSPAGWSFDPAALVRAVNRLHALGGERAAQLLYDYITRAEGGAPSVDAADNDPRRAALIARLLFVPSKPGAASPPLRFGQADVTLPDPDPVWPHLPLVLSGELPFLLVGGYFVGGAMRSARDLIDEYVAGGRLRAAPLRPAPPMEAVEALVESEAWGKLLPPAQEPPVRAMLYAQALCAAAPAYSASAADLQALAITAPADLAALWQRHSTAIRALGLHWDEDGQVYRSSTIP